MNEVTTMYRTSDPETSRIAAMDFVASGKKQTHSKMILDAIKGQSPMTATEIGNLIGLSEYQVCRRLPELYDKGFVVKCENRKCNFLGSVCQTWKEKP